MDAATKSVRSRLTPGGRKGGYSWGPDASTLMRQETDGAISFVGLDGTVIRSFRDKGDLMKVGTATVRLGTATATVFATVTKAGTTRLVLAGLDGKSKRVLAEGPAPELKAVTLWYSRK